MINNYNDFITENLVFKLLLEGNMVYSTKFIEILNTMNSEGKVKNMVDDIIGSINVNIDIKPNYIDVSDKSDTIKFIPDDKLDSEVLIYSKASGTVLSANNSLVYDMIKAGHIKSKDGLVDNLDFDNLGLKLINRFKIPGYGHLTFLYMKIVSEVEDEDKYVILYGETNPIITPSIPKSNRTSELKIGRFIKRFFDAYEDKSRFYTAADIEKFVEEYTSTILYMNNILDHFFVVDGEDIKYWYDVRNYEFKDEKGQLGQSCMRYDYCENYFKVYINNPDKCKLLIFKSKSNKLLGRALLWTLDDGSKYMDRIYTSQNSFNKLFKNWGIENNYINQFPLKNNNSVTIKNEVYENYPYMDTFDRIKFTTNPPSNTPISISNGHPYSTNGELVNVVLYNYSPERTFYRLESTSGYVSARIA